MKHYTKQVDKHNEVVTDDPESAADRYALRLSLKNGFSVAHVRAALRANAAVKEH
jgi:hypothetical protein